MLSSKTIKLSEVLSFLKTPVYDLSQLELILTTNTIHMNSELILRPNLSSSLPPPPTTTPLPICLKFIENARSYWIKQTTDFNCNW